MISSNALPPVSKESILNDLPLYIKQNYAKFHKESGSAGSGMKDLQLRTEVLTVNMFASELDFIVIGPDRIRENEQLRANLGLVTSESSKKKKAIQISGAILAANPWSTIVNDIFMHTAIQLKKDVIYLNNGKDIVLKDIWNGKFTTLGRELAILKIADYKILKVSNKFIYFGSCQETRITIAELRDAILKQKPDDVYKFATKKA